MVVRSLGRSSESWSIAMAACVTRAAHQGGGGIQEPAVWWVDRWRESQNKEGRLG